MDFPNLDGSQPLSQRPNKPTQFESLQVNSTSPSTAHAAHPPPTIGAGPTQTPVMRTPGGTRRKSIVAVARDKATAIKEHKFLRNTVMRRRSSIKSAVASMPADRRLEYKQAFNLFGPDNNGKVAAESIARVLHTLGWSPNVESLKMLVAEVDYNGDGAIGLEEFMVMLHGPPRSTRDVAAVLEAFKCMAFDTAGTGHIKEKRLRVLLENVGMRIQPAVVDTLLADAARMKEAAVHGRAAARPKDANADAEDRAAADPERQWDYQELVRLISDVDLSSKMYEERLRTDTGEHHHHHHAKRHLKTEKPMSEAEIAQRRRDARDKRVLLGKTPHRRRA